MEEDNTVFVKCKCKYCGCEFTTDKRHPHACCCGSPTCKCAAARVHSKKHYHSLKDNYGSLSGREDPYHRMLDRKKSERQKRLCPPAVPASSPSIPHRPAPPRIRTVSTVLLVSVLEMLVSLICGMDDSAEIRRCLYHNLERMLDRHESRECQTEMRNFLKLFQV